MSTDDALVTPVARFVGEVAPALASVARHVEGVALDRLHHDAVLEAFNLAAAFVDADGRHGDAELWALVTAFGPHLETQLAGATPADVREAGLVVARRRALDAPSALFELLVEADAKAGTAHARTYYDRALDIAFAVAAIDTVTSVDELEAIERYRSLLLAAMRRRGAAARATTSGPAAPASSTDAPPTDAATTEAAPLPPPRPLDVLLDELDALVGMVEVKREVKLVANLIKVENIRRQRNLPVLDQSRHLVFTGNPGTGKTTVARLLAEIYRTLGVVAKGHLTETDRSQLVAGFVGQTAIRVREVFDRADEGVLLIDEAYALARGGERDFGREAIDTIVKLVEDRRGSIVVIVAGYPEEMAEFVGANPGLRSRFPKTIAFPDYDDEELWQIFASIGAKAGYRCDAAGEAAVRSFFAAEPRTKGFGNGRLARNLFEAAVANQATRLVALDHPPTDEELQTLTAEDVPAGSPTP